MNLDIYGKQVGAQSSHMKMVPLDIDGGFSWQAYSEISAFEDSTLFAIGLLEQINTTRDTSDYLWYITE